MVQLCYPRPLASWQPRKVLDPNRSFATRTITISQSPGFEIVYYARQEYSKLLANARGKSVLGYACFNATIPERALLLSKAVQKLENKQLQHTAWRMKRL